MCTAITYKTEKSYFGRTLDYEMSFGEEIVVTPRKYAFDFGVNGRVISHYAIIGIAHITDNYPLYYDAINEHGVGIAGLNFVGNAVYEQKSAHKQNIAPHELIPYILCQCKSVEQAKGLLNNINIENRAVNETLPIAELHWIISDKNEAITVESTKDGLKVYENKVGVLTNNPPFDMQIFNLNNYINLSATDEMTAFAHKCGLSRYSRGMGALGLPGDLSSQSRFVRACFVKTNSISDCSEMASVNQFFHILGAVEQQRGCCEVEKDKYEITIYTSCYNLDRGIYYYTTYGNRQISSVDMHKENLDDTELTRFQLVQNQSINYQN